MNSQSNEIKAKVIENIRADMADFGIGEFELLERISVRLDVDQFNSSEDESVWLQKKGKAPFVCEVYFDNVWMCDLHETDTHLKLMEKYLKGFLNAYENNRIRLNRLLGVQLDEMEKAAQKAAKEELDKSLKDLPTATPEEKMAKEIVQEIVEEKTNETHTTTT